ncbi:capsular exopolysaccharide family [Desulfovibrio sp. X2]|uniref:XrtA-associated tyrosine autokinase n=1 Tax=Desulfovibrio sp. X2 TaxID=941449 RepID=UPI000358EE8A|nr:XrtA-associated tyrosine autokinase [Desulfovibrio sp. X2]EPR37246.1 capsular exopolysaccharide family [Desulfovibrio sp. X2]
MSRIEEALSKAAGMKPAVDGPRPSQAKSVAASKCCPMPETPEMNKVSVRESTLVSIFEPQSPAAEEYRKLKESLVKLTRKDRFNNLIMVTSATMGEGKTMTAINLAVSLAQEYDHTVLLVDADFRRPTCHLYLGLEPEVGLSDCLLEGRDIGEALVKTGIGKLALLPAGSKVSNPAELFSSQAMKNIFTEMKGRYADRYVIIDTPPVLPFAETRSLASIADGVILVVREGGPSLDEVETAVGALERKVLGVVYNAAKSPPLHSGYYYYNR